MATRNIVPRADNEGGIGTTLKKWATAFINTITAAAIAVTGLTASRSVFTDDSNNLVSGSNTDTQIAAAVAAAHVQNTDTAFVTKATYDANTILAANSDDTPAAVTMTEQTVLGRLTGGNIKALSVAELQALVAASGGMQWSAITSDPAPAVSQHGYLCDTSGAAFSVTLPASPSVGDIVGVADGTGTFDSNNLTIGRATKNIMGIAEDLVVDRKNASFCLVYEGASAGWRIV